MKKFDQIIGYKEIKEELYQIIDMFKNSDLYKEIGANIPHGLALVGAPGLGKSCLAEALIEECDVDTFRVKYDETEEKFINAIKTAFDNASKCEKSIVFIDDIDHACEQNNSDCDASVFTCLQSNIDKVKDKNVLVVITANKFRKLPESLRRSGRIDRKINVTIPSQKDAEEIIKYYLGKLKLSDDINLEDISKMVSYTSCADLETLMNESAIIATYKRKKSVEMDDIINAYLRREYGVKDKEYSVNEKDIESVVKHECGHAVCAEVLKDKSVGFISLGHGSTGGRGGTTQLCDEFTRRPESVIVGLGGKVASELFYEGRVASGCQSDLDKVISLIYSGMTTNATAGFGLLRNEEEHTSDSYKARLEAAVIAELEKFKILCSDVLLKNKEFYDKLCSKLKEKKYLLYSDIQEIKSTCNIVRITV